MTEAASKDTNPPTSGQSIAQKAGLFYRSCDMVWRGQRDELPTIRDALRRVGIMWPRRAEAPNVLRTLFSLSIELDWAVVIGVVPLRKKVWVDVPDSFEFIAREQERLRRLGGRRRSFEFIRNRFSDKHITTTIRYEELSRLEEAFLLQLNDARKRENEAQVPANVVDKQKWAALLIEFNMTTVPLFLTKHLSYITKFHDLWKNFGENATHLFISWMAVRYTSQFANNELIFNYYASTNYDVIKYHQGRWCFKLAYKFVGDYIFAPYNSYAFNLEIRRDVENIVLAIRKKFASRLSSKPPYSTYTFSRIRWSSLAIVMSVLNTTMDSDFKFKTPTSSVPDMTLSLARNWQAAWRMKRFQKIDPVPLMLVWDDIHTFWSYSLWGGDFVLAPYILSFPLYDLGLVDAVKYGAFGAHVAEACANISILRYASAKTTAGAINAAINCIEATGARGRLAALRDVAALEVLADAFETHGSRSKLAKFSSMTEAQLLFATWCYIRCRGNSEALSDECSSAVRHVAAFSEAFSCSVGKPLNPENKCVVF
ncbi:hypothetical protein V5799_006819 [Amblyomma americanum]|uniref:Uncharacterized protein n=1 Tax=Amblyomma americanum TaxID=6943 RepID=A0AAQ4DVB0_AMBAM